ncbi:hypothetical protein AYO47_06535 [Planctomyces sp. SCGC AG-212-M04]|nr:hypothetical protein AYO47_06535 [Planctomyces sp. SCGC AG-212-M04]
MRETGGRSVDDQAASGGILKSNTRLTQWLRRIIVGLYLATWAGGTLSHWLTIRRSALKSWESLRQHEAKLLAEGKLTLIPEKERAFANGPRYWLSYSVPLLPGLLLVSSSMDCGGRFGGGQQYLLFYYGFGSMVLQERTTWVY